MLGRGLGLVLGITWLVQAFVLPQADLLWTKWLEPVRPTDPALIESWPAPTLPPPPPDPPTSSAALGLTAPGNSFSLFPGEYAGYTECG